MIFDLMVKRPEALRGPGYAAEDDMVLAWTFPVMPRAGERIEFTGGLGMTVEKVVYPLPGHRVDRGEANSQNVWLFCEPDISGTISREEWAQLVNQLHRSPAVTPGADRCECCGYRS
jgi:hypothetical protein